MPFYFISGAAFFLKNDFRKNKNGSTSCEDSASNPFFHYCAILFGSRCDSADLLRLGVVRLCGVSYGNWVACETRSRKTFPHLSHSSVHTYTNAKQSTHTHLLHMCAQLGSLSFFLLLNGSAASLCVYVCAHGGVF